MIGTPDGRFYKVGEGWSYRFTVTLESNYMLVSVKVNGTELESSDGEYRITDIRENKTVDVTVSP